MSPLHPLQRQLSRLRWYRWTVAVGAAVCAVAIAVLWTLLLLFACDLIFQLPVSQRAAALAIGGLAAAWLVRTHVRDGLRLPEHPSELALLVERNHNLDSDLIAALQFQAATGAVEMGSPALRQAVIQRAADLSRRINFFQGVGAAPLPGRVLLLTVTAGICLTLAFALPGHAEVFWRRLMMGRQHYPTATRFQRVLVNGATVLDGREDPTLTPREARCAEGRPVRMLVQLAGQRPESGVVRLFSGGVQGELALTRLSIDDRFARLQQARQLLQQPMPELAEAADLAIIDCPAASALLTAADADTQRAGRLLTDAVADGRERLRDDSDWYRAELPRHGSSLRYQLAAGDAWTEPGEVRMIPLPAVSLEALATSPDYSGLGVVKMSPGARQLRVLEGSRVDLSIRSVNNKRLTSAWAVIARDGQPPLRLELSPGEDRWRLDPEGTPLERVEERLQYTIQVVDSDGLQLPNAVSGQIQIRPDRAPTGSAGVLHRVVLPSAVPRIAIRANDDFGIGKLQLHLLVEKKRDDVAAPPPGVSIGASSPTSETGQELTIPVRQYRPGQSPPLPLELEHPLPLEPLKLVKGDRVKITLAVIDDRGASPGAAFEAEPLTLEVSDEAGVLAAVSESDEQSERKLNELIQQQLGIGESP